MFISQVIFSSREDTEDTLRAIMTAKLISSRKTTGCISSELWKTRSDKETGYCLLVKWENRECFQKWMGETHSSKGNQSEEKPENVPPITKTLYQFEEINL